MCKKDNSFVNNKKFVVLKSEKIVILHIDCNNSDEIKTDVFPFFKHWLVFYYKQG